MTDICISCDRGGTFCDMLAEYTASDGSRQRKVLKLLSVNPNQYQDAASEGVRRLLTEITGTPYPSHLPIAATAPLTRVRLGTTVATNALLERKGCDVIFVTTEGLEDVLEIGTQTRPNIFALSVVKPTPLYSKVIGAGERVVVIPKTDTHNDVEVTKKAFPFATVVQSPTTFEDVMILKPLDVERITSQLEECYKINPQSSIAVALAHSYAFDKHELMIKDIALKIGFNHVSISSELSNSIKLLSRAHSATADAYLTPILKEYIDGFLRGFEPELLKTLDVKFMRSDGGLTDAKGFLGHVSLLSGPAGGYMAFSSVSRGNDEKKPKELIKFVNTNDQILSKRPAILDNIPDLATVLDPVAVGVDIGGTSSDCAIAGPWGRELIFESIISNVHLVGPSLNVSTLASGGGSILSFDNNLFTVGPESAGSYPGPACYHQTKDSQLLAVTDANLMIGKINVDHFPAIFGPNQDEKLSKEETTIRFDKLTKQINAWRMEQYQANIALAGSVDGKDTNDQNDQKGGYDDEKNDMNTSSDKTSKSLSTMDPSTPPKTLTNEEVALGFLSVSFAQIARGVSALTEARGYDIRDCTLSSFGGAGGQSCCSIADTLSIKTIHMHSLCSILSAYGIHQAPVVAEDQVTLNSYLDGEIKIEGGDSITALNRVLELTKDLTTQLLSKLASMGVTSSSKTTTSCHLSLKYETTDTPLMIELSEEIMGLLAIPGEKCQRGIEMIKDLFFDQYRAEFGFLLERKIIIETLRVRSEAIDTQLALTYGERKKIIPQPKDFLRLFLGTQDAPSKGKWYENVPLYDRNELEAGIVIPGPCYLIDKTTTIIVEPTWVAIIYWDSVVLIKQDEEMVKNKIEHNFVVEHNTTTTTTTTTATTPRDQLVIHGHPDAVRHFPCDPIQLSLFQNRFMAITDNMCRVLQKTAASQNIKSRLDFSCCLLNSFGGLIQCAPNLPVHLGSMSTCVVAQIDYCRDNGIDLVEGDTIITNDPNMGGSHLPDITIITPFFIPGRKEPAMFFASRGHHADIGSISPGSMPCNSKFLCQEGINITHHKVVRGNGPGKVPVFDESGLAALFTTPPSCGHPECVATRGLSDNINDIRAQIAANNRGVRLMKTLLETFGVNQVIAYMFHIQATAEQSSRDLLKDAARTHYLNHVLPKSSQSLQSSHAQKSSQSSNNDNQSQSSSSESNNIVLPDIVTLDSIDYMDDGTAIKLAVQINTLSGDAVFDFTGTGCNVLGNTNAPLSVVRSAIIYCLRSMITKNIPLNQGILTPLSIVIPPNTILSPAPHLGVVGGNVLTSQRITDVILMAFKAVSNSYGCMNNFSFGSAGRYGYYETICGGLGASKLTHGADATQAHMTNTAIGDCELVERKYPVLLRRFQINHGSGGAGVKHGGSGVIREVQFLITGTDVNILSERRSLAPNGLYGGESGAKGVNYLVNYQPPVPGQYVYDKNDGDKSLFSLGGKNTFKATNQQGIRILTPGGGGYGKATDAHNAVDDHTDAVLLARANRDTTVVGSLAQFKHTQETQ